MTVRYSNPRSIGVTVEEHARPSPLETRGLPLIDRLGGLPVVAWIADRFGERLLDDPQLATAFAGVDVQALKTSQEAFFVQALGGVATVEWTASPVVLDGGQLALLALHLNDTLESLGLSQALVERVFDALVARAMAGPTA